jgi:IclR family acetate operon transcriptional repressor
VQRMLVTLAEAGWIRPEPERSTKWRVTQRLRLLSDIACTVDDLRIIARPSIEALRDASGETVSLIVQDADRFIVSDVAESHEMLRAAPRIGGEVPGPVSASSLAFLPFLSRSAQIVILGREPDQAIGAQFNQVREQGFAVLESTRGGGTVSLASPVFDTAGNPIAAIVLSAPIARLSPGNLDAIGREVRQVALALSGH